MTDRNMHGSGEQNEGPVPLVSIVIPAFNDDGVIEGALRSCLRQSLTAIEVIVVDDASLDETAHVVERFAAKDSRVRLIRHPANLSAFQARRTGILSARADHVLFLDGDDELADHAAETALNEATATNADLVQFGVSVIHRDGTQGGSFEERLQPRSESLAGAAVLRGLFPSGRPAQGHLWRFLFRTRLLKTVIELMPDDLVLPRVNDLPVTFLAAAMAENYRSIPDRLYHYHFGRGGSGQKVHDLDWVRFYSSAIQSIDSIGDAVDSVASQSADADFVREAYESARKWIIGYTTGYLAEHTTTDLLSAAFTHLVTCAPATEIVRATAAFAPHAIETLAAHTGRVELGDRPVRSVLLTTKTLRTGGVSGVLLSQAQLLLRAGYSVTIAAHGRGSVESAVPDGAHFVTIEGETLADRLTQWGDLCRERGIDLVIDHHWLYSTRWPAFALAARAEGAATIGWAHNFAGRSVLLGLNSLLEFQTRHMGALAQLIVLSPLDVAFWKLRGMPRVAYLPNPPSPLLLKLSSTGTPRHAPEGRPIELIWWGRLEQRTKRVGEFVRVATHLRDAGVDFRMRVIGPDWDDMSAAELNALARTHRVDGVLEATGPLYGEDLVAAIDSSDVFVNTSIIEGYPLTLPEAQSRGLPVVMYEMPWLALAQDNEGIVAVRQGDAHGLAARIVELISDSDRYAELSANSIRAAQRELSYDFSTLYSQLVTGDLPEDLSPEPRVVDARQLIDLMIVFAEQNAKDRHLSSSRVSRARTAVSRQSETRGSTQLVRFLTPAARTVLAVAPWLLPSALRVRHSMLRR